MKDFRFDLFVYLLIILLFVQDFIYLGIVVIVAYALSNVMALAINSFKEKR